MPQVNLHTVIFHISKNPYERLLDLFVESRDSRFVHTRPERGIEQRICGNFRVSRWG